MRHSKSSLFLMEMIIAILFFSLASVVCIQLFAKAHTLSRHTVNQNHAMLHAQNLAECYLAQEGDLQQITPLFKNADSDLTENILYLYFDKEWNASSASNAAFRAELKCNPTTEIGLISADIVITAISSAPKELYILHVAHHIAERRGTP